MSVAFPALTEDKLRTIDLLRQRLNQLSTSLGSIKVDLERNEPLPSWPSLQSSAQILLHNLSQLLTTFETHREFLKSAHAFPLTTFPGHTHEALLNQLLRKRLEPTVEEWIKQYGDDNSEDRTTSNNLKELWSQAGPSSNAIIKRMIEDEAFEDDFTLAEKEAGVENVVTGLRRKMWEDDSDAGEAEDSTEKMEDIKQDEASELVGIDKNIPPMAVENILRMITIGSIPNQQPRP